MHDYDLSPNFKVSEFGFVEPEPELLFIVQWLRNKYQCPVSITSHARDISDHIQVYKNIAQDRGERENKTIHWQDIIHWTSRHLPRHDNPLLRAIDFGIKAADGYMQGWEIKAAVQECIGSPEFKIEFSEIRCFGFGTGHRFLHLDVGDRKETAEWGYDY